MSTNSYRKQATCWEDRPTDWLFLRERRFVDLQINKISFIRRNTIRCQKNITFKTLVNLDDE